MFANPYEFFDTWFKKAADARLPQHNAMALVTANERARPSARMVLLRGIVEGKFQFFTNYESRKARELIENPQAQLLFYWPQFGHQIRIEGSVSTLSARASDEYWNSRPRKSRIGSLASHQSRTLESMEELQARVHELEALHTGREVPRPDHWGGFGLTPERFEFWNDGEFRLHERIVYERAGDEWTVGRLWP